jgi:BolA family transcriptional regulator, general stress-responsive regulator
MSQDTKSRKSMSEDSLNTIFSPERLEIVNESHLHAGHHHGDGRPFDGSGETHFRVRIVSSAFAGKSRLERHRAVNAALDCVLKDGLHALAIDASAPGEVTRW